MSDQEARDERVETLPNGDLRVTDNLGREARLHWSRFHGLIVSMGAPGAVYLGQPETLAWIADAAGYRTHMTPDEALKVVTIDSVAQTTGLSHAQVANILELLGDKPEWEYDYRTGLRRRTYRPGPWEPVQ